MYGIDAGKERRQERGKCLKRELSVHISYVGPKDIIA